MRVKEWTKFVIDDLELEDDVIFVENKDDVIKTDEMLSEIGIPIFSTDEIREEWKTQDKDVCGNYLIKDDEGWRIQSHYLGNGINVDVLEEKLNKYISEYPTIKDDNKKEDIRSIFDELLIEMNNKYGDFIDDQDDIFKNQIEKIKSILEEKINKL